MITAVHPAMSLPKTIESETTSSSATTATPRALLSERLSAWGSRLQASASKAVQTAADSVDESTPAPPCGLYIQTSVGAFLPLDQKEGNPSKKHAITTTSIISIRKSVDEACPLRGYTYQWYRGLPSLDQTSPFKEWVLVPDATSAVFQPSATEVGFKLLCQITLEEPEECSSSLDSDDEDDDTASPNREPVIIRCITVTISSDLALFNGARQALVRGANFGGLIGKGNAQGRTFRVQVQMGSYQHKNSKKKRVASSVKVDQTTASGETAEPLHTDPFYHVSAHSSHANSKSLELQFRQADLADCPASLMSALVTEDGLLPLVAPNRLARESLLLAIGIANFKGKPADLEPNAILFPSTSSDEEDALDEQSFSDESSSGSGSSATSVADVVENLILSPGNSPTPSLGAGSTGDLSSIASADSEDEHRNESPTSGPSVRELELEQEIALLRAKLTKKDKVVSELQRDLTRCDAELQHATEEASNCQQKVGKLETELQSSQRSQKAAEQKVEQHLATIQKRQTDHASQVSQLEEQLRAQKSSIADLEKAVKSHHNENAVLTAAVEVRERKLAKMTELQDKFLAMSSRVSEQKQLRQELEETKQRHDDIKADCQRMAQWDMDCRKDLETTQAELQSVKEELETSKETSMSWVSDLKASQTKNRILQSERNAYKQKAESLSKEINRICRGGRTLADVEEVLVNEEALQEEVELLRKQKRKAVEECHSYRKSYEQSKAAQELLSQSSASNDSTTDANNNTAVLLERNVELERLVTSLTEYLNAKEMQLETMKQVNAALQEEIHGLAQANMNRNEV